ncbi:hypothetical protein DYL59_20925 [Pseudomonas kairouanensis]|uniref:Uncharacterized protein n=1 Tax=Pseudomonas kairouanensis TaxID=2293832 RepID=A0A4Z0AKF1_9PSED|nr:hypothetical protein DYL59_20925 [Pseudomonas kairouanensis]
MDLQTSGGFAKGRPSPDPAISLCYGYLPITLSSTCAAHAWLDAPIRCTPSHKHCLSNQNDLVLWPLPPRLVLWPLSTPPTRNAP